MKVDECVNIEKAVVGPIKKSMVIG